MKILLPVDGSEPALDAVKYAIRLVNDGLRASFVLANVQEKTHLYEMVLARDEALVERASADAGLTALQSAEALLQAAALPYEREVGWGEPAHLLIDIAERFECDAIVMGTQGHGALRNALRGSVAQTVLDDATIPVTLVKHVESATADDAAPEAEVQPD